MSTNNNNNPKPAARVMPSMADLDKEPVKPAPAAEPEPGKPVPDEPKPEPAKPAPASTPAPAKDPLSQINPKPEPVVEPETEEPEEEEEEEGSPDPMAYWGEVAKLRGDNPEWEFPQDVDPLSPQAVHHALNKAEEWGMNKLEHDMKLSMPRVYAYMLHSINGGSDEEFFASKTEALPDLEAMKDSLDSQKAFYARVLRSRGVEEEHVDLLVKDAVEKNKLYNLIEKEHGNIKKAQDAQMKELIELNARNELRQKTDINNMTLQLRERIFEGKHMNIQVPDAKKQEFLQFVNSQMYYDRDSGRFFFQKEVSKEDMGILLEAMYYMKAGGNMKDIIYKEAQAHSVKQLRLKMKSEKQHSSADQNPKKSSNTKSGVQPAISEL